VVYSGLNFIVRSLDLVVFLLAAEEKGTQNN